jgi:polar amino acid transport system substrate-binding protein
VRTYDGGQNEIYADLVLGRTDAVLLDAPISLYYGEIEPALEGVDGDFGEVRYAIAAPLGADDLRDALDAALGRLAADGRLRALYERWGLWNPGTATLLGDPHLRAAASPRRSKRGARPSASRCRSSSACATGIRKRSGSSRAARSSRSRSRSSR